MIPIRAEVNDRLNFKFEFYDLNTNKANYEATSSEMLFQGPNTFIGGGNNILSGSMVIGNTIGSGIEMAGVSSGFIRSIGYEGFISASAGNNQAGFMIWSGSALPNAPDNYSDVGLELNAGPNKGSFKFRTNPTVLDIKADAFFVGSTATQFMSGANSNIEISSSGFHLDTANDFMEVAGWKLATVGGNTVLAFSLTGATITPGTGPVLTLSLSGDEAGDASVCLDGIVVSDPSGSAMVSEDSCGSFMVEDGPVYELQYFKHTS